MKVCPIVSLGIANRFEEGAAIDTEYHFLYIAAQIASCSSLLGIHTGWYLFNASFLNPLVVSDTGVCQVSHSSEIPEIYDKYPMSGVTTQQILN